MATETVMSMVRIASSLLILASALGCAVDTGEPDEPLERVRAAQIKDGWLECVRERSDLPDGHNIDSWIIACIGAGGTVSCSGGTRGSTPMCCKDQADGSRECSDDPGDLTRSNGVLDVGPIVDTVAQGSQPKSALSLDGEDEGLDAIDLLH